jgi:hypothetical protein
MVFKCRSMWSKGLAGDNNLVARLQAQGTAFDPSQASRVRDLQALQVVFNLNAGSETDILDSLAGPCIYIAPFLTPVRPVW